MNGHPAGAFELGPGLPFYELEVPAAFIRRNLNRIQLRYRYVMSPEAAGLSGDRRTLAVQVAVVRLTRLLLRRSVTRRGGVRPAWAPRAGFIRRSRRSRLNGPRHWHTGQAVPAAGTTLLRFRDRRPVSRGGAARRAPTPRHA